MSARVLAVAAGAWLVATIVAFARRRSAYSHLRHTISELGERGARDERAVAWAAFLPVGLAATAVAVLAMPQHPAAALLAGAIAVGYLAAGLFPCDPGSPMSGSLRQALHNAGGAVEYGAGALALMWLGEVHGLPFRAAGLAVGVAMLLLMFSTPLRGLVQRIAETCLFAGLAAATAIAARA